MRPDRPRGRAARDGSYVPRHLAGDTTTSPSESLSGTVVLRALGGLLMFGAVIATAVVMDGASPRGETPSPVAAAGAAGSDGEGDASDAGIPGVERPAHPVGSPTSVVQPSSPPIRVDIPKIGVSSGLESLGLDEAGALQAPVDFQVAGWFAAGTEPGQPGPAVIAGHVDSQDGPAVFYRLGELAPGDEVVVARADGSEVRFRVTTVETHPKDTFPTAAVYGPVPGPELRLITCGGPFDRSNRQYLDNVVVYAVAV